MMNQKSMGSMNPIGHGHNASTGQQNANTDRNTARTMNGKRTGGLDKYESLI